MNISELFYSIQGEGELTGVPSVFIRLTRCNLRCRWCDTPYASRHGATGKDYTINELISYTQQYPACTHTVITGGEPMLCNDLAELTRELQAEKQHVTIETNGTLPPGHIRCDLASISPKLSHSQTTETNDRIQIATLQEWIDRFHTQFKFVVQHSDDISEIEQIMQKLSGPPLPRQIQLMPESSSETDPNWIIDICKEKGYRYCHRLQYTLFGNQRGT